MSAQPLLLLSRLRVRDQDSRRANLLSPNETYYLGPRPASDAQNGDSEVCGPCAELATF